MEKFLEMEETLMNENEDVIASLGLLDLENGNNRLQIDKFYFLSFASFKFFSFKFDVVFVTVDVFNLFFLVVIDLE